MGLESLVFRDGDFSGNVVAYIKHLVKKEVAEAMKERAPIGQQAQGWAEDGPKPCSHKVCSKFDSWGIEGCANCTERPASALD